MCAVFLFTSANSDLPCTNKGKAAGNTILLMKYSHVTPSVSRL